MVTVVRVVPPTSAYVGAQAVVEHDGTLHGWIGGGCAKSVVIRAAQKAIDTAVPKLVRISNEEQVADASTEVHAMACASDGSIELFIQPNVAHLVLILGTTPAAHEALELAGRMGFRITEDPGARPHFVIVATQGEGDVWSTNLFGAPAHAVIKDKRVILAMMPAVANEVASAKTGLAGKLKPHEVSGLEGLNVAVWINADKMFAMLKPQSDAMLPVMLMAQTADNPLAAKQMELSKQQIDMFVNGTASLSIGVGLNQAGLRFRFGCNTGPFCIAQIL